MKKVYVIGAGDQSISLAAMIADAGVEAELVSVNDIGEIDIPGMGVGDLVLNLSDQETFEDKAKDLEMTLRATEDWDYNLVNEKKLKKLEKRRENRSKKDRRNHR